MLAVIADDWNLTEMMDAARRCRLLGSLSPKGLLEQVEEEANGATGNNGVCVHWREACERKGYWRVEAMVPQTANTFDLLFNGRMGYRAQYYRSIDEGGKFNRMLLDRLTPAIKAVLENWQCGFPASWNQVEQSLKGPYSKVWVAGDWAVFYRAPKVLKPTRWVTYWSHHEDQPLGLAAPLPCEPALDLKGTFICEKTSKPWLPDSQKDRDQKIHCSGWT